LRGHGNRGRVGVVVLAAVPGGQHPDAGGELGGHVHSGDPVGGQPGGQGCTQPTGALDRPHGGGPAGGEAAQVAVALRVNRHPDRGQRPQPGAYRGGGPRRLVRIDTDHDPV
jgi:hypothetical protein